MVPPADRVSAVNEGVLTSGGTRIYLHDPQAVNAVGVLRARGPAAGRTVSSAEQSLTTSNGLVMLHQGPSLPSAKSSGSAHHYLRGHRGATTGYDGASRRYRSDLRRMYDVHQRGRIAEDLDVHAALGDQLGLSGNHALESEDGDPFPSPEQWKTDAKLKGFQGAGPGRPQGSGIDDVRKVLLQISTVVFCRDVLSIALKDGAHDDLPQDARSAVTELRNTLDFFSDKKLNGRVWSLTPAKGVGLVVKFGRDGPRDSQGRPQASVLELSIGAGDQVACACSNREQCLRTACEFSQSVVAAFMYVSAACGVTGTALLRLLYVELGPAKEEGYAHLFGDPTPGLCAVKNAGGNWPWAMVRKSRANFWTCLTCVEQGLLCTHAKEAGTAYRAYANDSASAEDEEDVDEDDDKGLTPLQERVKKYNKSHKMRHAVPSAAAFEHEALLRQKAIDGVQQLYVAPRKCYCCDAPFRRVCHRGWEDGRAEFEDGAASCAVLWWVCWRCAVHVVPEGGEEGVVFTSTATAYTEPFLFLLAYGLVANGSSLSGSAQLRRHFIELAGDSRLPSAASSVRTLAVLRRAIMLYLELVVEGYPDAVLRCAQCEQPDGSYAVICFDGLYMGIRRKHIKELSRITLPLGILSRANASCSLIFDAQMVLAMAYGLRLTPADNKGKFEVAKPKSIRAVNGYIYAVACLFPAALQESTGRTAGDGGRDEETAWDPKDGKMHSALVDFMRVVLLGRDVALLFAKAVGAAPTDVLRKIPPATLTRLSQFVVHEEQAAADRRAPRQRPDHARAAVFNEPALADTGGARYNVEDGATPAVKVSLHASIPSTVNGAANIVEFVRALCAQTVFVWSSNGKWDAIEALVSALADDNWSERALEAALNQKAVCELRVLRRAVASLVPALVELQPVRCALRDVLSAVLSTKVKYGHFLQGDSPDSIEEDVPLTQTTAADPQLGRSITPTEYDSLWLSPPVNVSSLSHIYGAERVSRATDYHSSGVFCPLLPPIRPGFQFEKGGALSQEDSLCEKDYGSAAEWSSGTFGVFCCCAHPKCIAVIMMDGHEGPRMPLDFICSRLPTMPKTVIYDFACGTHRAATCRVPRAAMTVRMCVDLFHFRKGHSSCSTAMSPPAYETLLGVNTSSSEQRNAATRRLKPFIRLLNQRNFLTFSAYQQCMSNVTAMYRDALDNVEIEDPLRSMGWPLWYRQSHAHRAPQR